MPPASDLPKAQSLSRSSAQRRLTLGRIFTTAIHLLEDMERVEVEVKTKGISAAFDIPVNIRSLIQVANLDFQVSRRGDAKIVGAAASVILLLTKAPAVLETGGRLALLAELRHQLHQLVSEIVDAEPDIDQRRIHILRAAAQRR